MADLYSGVSITGYNSNPPPDDGTQTEANRVKWATIKTKLNDPVKARTDDIDTALIAAFGKIDAGVTSTSINYTVLSTDQGKLVRATSAGITITTPDATDVDAPFVFALLNDTAGDITLDGSGSQTIDGDGSVTVPPGCGFRVRTDGSNFFTEGKNFQRTLVRPQGYLTLLSVASSPLSPLPTSDQSAKTAVYYRPHVGNLIPIPNGTTFAVREFSELTLTLVTNHVSNGIYDVFAFDDAGEIRIGTGPVWNTVTAGSGARGTGAGTTELDVLKGLLVNKVAITARNGSTTYSVAAASAIYLGSLYIDGTAGQVTCHVSYGQSRKWGVWNAHNRETIIMQAGDPASTWVYSTNTIRPSNNSSVNSVSVFSGLPEGVEITFTQTVEGGQGSTSNQVLARWISGIGWNSTTAMSGQKGIAQVRIDGSSVSNLNDHTSTAQYIPGPVIGVNTATCLEQVTNLNNASVTWTGTISGMLMLAKWRG